MRIQQIWHTRKSPSAPMLKKFKLLFHQDQGCRPIDETVLKFIKYLTRFSISISEILIFLLLI